MKKNKFFTPDKTSDLILNALFLLTSLSLLLSNKNMFALHIIAVSLMILVLVKSYYRGIKSGLMWFGFIIFPWTISMFNDGALTTNEFSEILLILGPSITVGLLAERQRMYVRQLKGTYISTLKALAEATDARDSYTHGHSERVAEYAALIAKQMLLSEPDLNFLEQAALLHDIGKIAVPDEVLHKKEPLDENDWLIIRKHPEYSRRIISKLDFLSPVLPIILYHHKRFDNKGYPGEQREAVPLASRILAVADAFDAMTSDRPYRDKLNREQALKELERRAGTQFDPVVVEAFVKVMDRDTEFNDLGMGKSIE